MTLQGLRLAASNLSTTLASTGQTTGHDYLSLRYTAMTHTVFHRAVRLGPVDDALRTKLQRFDELRRCRLTHVMASVSLS